MAYKNKFGEFQIMDLNENTFKSFEGVFHSKTFMMGCAKMDIYFFMISNFD